MECISRTTMSRKSDGNMKVLGQFLVPRMSPAKRSTSVTPSLPNFCMLGALFRVKRGLERGFRRGDRGVSANRVMR
jgi:hypothetical protein